MYNGLIDWLPCFMLEPLVAAAMVGLQDHLDTAHAHHELPVNQLGRGGGERMEEPR